MYTTARELRRCAVCGIDREAGPVADVFFDDRSWRVRYVVADTGSWLHRHGVLLTPALFGGIDPVNHTLRVSLTAFDIERLPSVDADPPVAVLMEQQLHDVVSLASSWVAGFSESYVHPLTAVPPTLHYPPIATARPARSGDPHLRSASHVLGNHVLATDGPVGAVEDFVVDDAGWRVIDLVVQTHGWPHRKSVLVPTRWVEDVSWGMRTVRIDVPRERIDRSY